MHYRRAGDTFDSISVGDDRFEKNRRGAARIIHDDEEKTFSGEKHLFHQDDQK